MSDERSPREPPDDPVYLHARREAWVAFLGWLAAGIYTVGYCYLFGYDLDRASLRTILGLPSWIVFGIILPWTVAVGFGVWFGLVLVKDEDLGRDTERDADE